MEIKQLLTAGVSSIILSGAVFIGCKKDTTTNTTTTTTSYTITTIAGTGTAGNSGDGGSADSAELRDPAGVAIDAFGNVYIADYGNNRVRKINTNGIISTIAGSGYINGGGGIIEGGYSGDGGQATSAALNIPAGVAVDGSGNIYC